MIIHEIEFLGSFEKESQCPKDPMPEYAFIGRSNVGKSSLINMLMGRKELARISSTPGKTQTLNYFQVNDKWRIVDLPGYGYARISKKMRKKWEIMIDQFLVHRRNLVCVFVLLDSRHSLQPNDLDFINSLGTKGIPFVIAYTKIDKLKDYEVSENVEKIRNGLLEHWESLPQEFITSANTSAGRDEILGFVEEINNNSDF